MALDTMQGPGTRAPEPAPPSRQFSFTGWQVNNPTAPPPGDRLDGEFDRINASAAQALAWTATLLNTDGTLRPGTVGRAQLQSGLFDRIARDIIGECVAPVDQVQRAASSAFVSAAQSAVNMGVAIAQANGASDSAGTANAAALVATQARDEALDFTGTAADAAVQSSNDANDAAKASNVAQDYAVLAAAWAEHMPDTIPPNILAANDITGDHWSSRWWANQAAQYVHNATDGSTIVTTSDTVPALAADGDLWWDSAGGNLYVYYDDGNSQQWVITNTAAAAGPYLPVAGGTMTGALTTPQVTLHNTSGPSIQGGTGLPAGVYPGGSLWLRTDGAAGSHVYVSAGDGTWVPIAGV